MKRLSFLAMLLLLTGLALSSCQSEDISNDAPTFDDAQLRAGTWTVDRVIANQFDGDGRIIGSTTILFGEGEDGGICTFHYENGKWTMNDNGDIYSSNYTLDGRVINTDGATTWGIRQMSDTQLELALQGDANFDPCAYSISGSVYYLSRGSDK